MPSQGALESIEGGGGGGSGGEKKHCNAATFMSVCSNLTARWFVVRCVQPAAISTPFQGRCVLKGMGDNEQNIHQSNLM